jgi:hypothetical protein
VSLVTQNVRRRCMGSGACRSLVAAHSVAVIAGTHLIVGIHCDWALMGAVITEVMVVVVVVAVVIVISERVSTHSFNPFSKLNQPG